MIKKPYRKLIAGHLQWSLFGLIIVLFGAFISSDYRSEVFGSVTTESGVSETSGGLAPSTSIAPAAAPQNFSETVAPDTLNGELVWPDPWDQITVPDGPFY